ncbi:SLBB domain-containing protein [Polluticaenibacter yanchengensis]|uniref:SLBB domain-containing protein n=1 Tax=Polluticaenibacter yanchengensis TaxID=3014562 RepID=A0ABT4UNK1_9BACT|nr:SLBB domain-containing protein [Chitinophagaceae bacterium LY-5]
MRINYLLYTLLCFFVIFTTVNTVSAQGLNTSNLKDVKVDNLSDDEIMAYYNKAKSMGYTVDQLGMMAADRNMPHAEIVKLKNRIAVLEKGEKVPVPTKTKVTEKNNTDSLAGNNKSASDREVNEDAFLVPKQSFKRDSTIFGSELFFESNQVFEPNLRIPSPANYILGPDDVIYISVYGYSEKNYELTVNAEGNIYIENIGPVKVSGLTIEEAGAKIRKNFASTIYKGINSGQTKVDVTLGSIRSIRVTVIGQAMKPGTYTVSSLTTLFNLLYQCGGPSDNGSYRNIELIRGNKVIKTVDLYSFITMGNKADNVLLQEQDVVRIPYYQIRTTLNGQSRRQGKFELKDGESLRQLLDYSGGFSDSAYRSNIQIKRLSDLGYKLYSVTENEFETFKLKSGDVLTIDKALNRFLNRVSIEGSVFRPGDYELKKGMTLKDLLTVSGGLKEDAFLERAIITRTNSDLSNSTIAIGLKDWNASSDKVILENNDIIKINSKFDLKDMETVSINGEVRNPGVYTYSNKITLKDLILKAGGFTDAANKRGVEISRSIKKIDAQADVISQAYVLKADLSKGLEMNDNDIPLQPTDVVSVRTDAQYNRIRSVNVLGEVMRPGNYVLTSSGERISGLIERFGGFKSIADSNSITIKRIVNTGLSASERQEIMSRMLNIKKDSLLEDNDLKEAYLKDVVLMGVDINKVKSDIGGKDDLILEDGDLIQISRTSNVIQTIGELRNPTLLTYESGKTAKYYIKKSGSFTSKSKKSEVFVLYPDGTAKSVKKFLFFKSYPEVKSRSQIYVPAKVENKRSMSTGEWLAVSSMAATLGTMVIAILNVTK